ncbi:RagB/SusD family nutrient uptake outer membrane protein [Aequorivita antarctica]|uniref:RagB/SusD family nutrient uptake outer membrane protein n=1 Tax=Aequorivita antarctica TaxID=153266 RepID=A0A5C6YYG1_9FLAO|nr:RagB/SusD family nutrient uptake outer membrane protein [Aequorivita antarctica]TXD72730.1 RagB/SusD family nutrient uptake outer membrane protein [Aequorivita antarctica]SRX74746.1 SusD-like protein [Aequorivita antarctica]
MKRLQLIRNRLLNTPKIQFVGFVILLVLLGGCEDFLEVEFPEDRLTGTVVFNNEATANAALADIYNKLRDNTLLTGTNQGLSVLMGLYSDELDYYGSPGNAAYNFYNHTVIPSNSAVASLWNDSYNVIYSANAIIEGLEKSKELTQEQKEPLLGEALFLRAMVHFHLYTLFGDIPYITTTDYKVNSAVHRMDWDRVYSLLLDDLSNAKNFLPDSYPYGERIRPNRYVAATLLSKVYLYAEEWGKAETESSTILDGSGIYVWEENLDLVFQKESSTAIWQLKPSTAGSNTLEAQSFVVLSLPPSNVALSNGFVGSFEPNDLRREKWIGELSDGIETVYFPNKYKEVDFTGETLEYAVVFRLAELYLIRAEARAQQSSILGAVQDLNKIRSRAGLSGTTADSKEALLDAVLEERKHELFTEQGQRWFDLKRTNSATTVLGPIKPGWKATDILLPIPENELSLNPNLQPQNPGY